MEGVPCWFWSDSTVTLHWIRAPPNTWQTFIGNRISEIQHLTHGHTWNYVKGEDNPADYISRGMQPIDFVENPIWQCGPSWLLKSKEHWPVQRLLDSVSDEVLEKRKPTLITMINVAPTDTSLFEWYSSFWKLTRVTAYVLRFINRCRRRHHEHGFFITVQELQSAKEALVKAVQHHVFVEETKALKKKQPISSKSPLKNLRIVLDSKGILRVGGRLQ